MSHTLSDRDGAFLLTKHFELMMADPSGWSALFAPEAVWELAFAPSIGGHGRLEGLDSILKMAARFREGSTGFHMFDLQISALADPTQAVGRARGEGTFIKTGRLYEQEYVVFLQSDKGKITHLREYFNPILAARAMGIPLGDGESHQGVKGTSRPE